MSHVNQATHSATEQLPEGAPITAKALHLVEHAAVDQALYRLIKGGQLMRARRGLYVRPVTSQFGIRARSVERVVEGIAQSKIDLATRKSGPRMTLAQWRWKS